MANEEASLVQSSQTSEPFPIGFRLLIIDPDSTYLATVSQMLSAFGYKVTATTQGYEGLYILKEKEQELDFVLTESNLPDMDKFEFLEIAEQITPMPIVILSADENEHDILGCLFKGATFYIVKPMTENKAKQLWQFSFVKKRMEPFSIEGRNFEDKSPQGNECEYQTSVNTSDQNGRKQKKKVEETGDAEEGDDANMTTKKRKVVWTNELQERFLQAIWTFGLDAAHPRKILDHMNVQGLQKRHVASHLQKFRLSIKRGQNAFQEDMAAANHLSPAISIQRELDEFLHSQLLTIVHQPGFEGYKDRFDPMSMPSLGLAHLQVLMESNNYQMQEYGALAPHLPILTHSNNHEMHVSEYEPLAPEGYLQYSKYANSGHMNTTEELTATFIPVGNQNVEDQGANVANMEIDGSAVLVDSQQEQFQHPQPHLPPPPQLEKEDENMFDNENFGLDYLFNLPDMEDLNDIL